MDSSGARNNKDLYDVRFFEVGEGVRPQKGSKQTNIQTLTYYYSRYAHLIRKSVPDRKKLIAFSKSADKTACYMPHLMPDENLLLTSVTSLTYM